MISVIGEPAPELWAAADVTEFELHTRSYGPRKVPVYAAGHLDCEDLKWGSCEDLVAQLKELKRREAVRIGAWNA